MSDENPYRSPTTEAAATKSEPPAHAGTPLSLRLVASVFILFGILSAIDLVASLFFDRLSVNAAILGLLIGPGLLRHRPGWRVCPLVFVWFEVFGAGVAFFGLVMNAAPIRVILFHEPVLVVPRQGFLAVMVFLLLLAVWQYHVLTRPDVKALFGKKPRERRAGSEAV